MSLISKNSFLGKSNTLYQIHHIMHKQNISYQNCSNQLTHHQAGESKRQRTGHHGQDIRNHRLRGRSHGHGVLQRPKASELHARWPEHAPPLAGDQQVGSRRALPRRQQLMLVTLAHTAGNFFYKWTAFLYKWTAFRSQLAWSVLHSQLRLDRYFFSFFLVTTFEDCNLVFFFYSINKLCTASCESLKKNLRLDHFLIFWFSRCQSANFMWILCLCRHGPASSRRCNAQRSPASWSRTRTHGRSTRSSSSRATPSPWVQICHAFFVCVCARTAEWTRSGFLNLNWTELDINNAGSAWVRRLLLPAIMVHLGEGAPLLGHVHPCLHRGHHRRRRRRSPGGAAHWKARFISSLNDSHAQKKKKKKQKPKQ